MRSTNYGPPPNDSFREIGPSICDYEMSCDEYTGVYLMSQILDKLHRCDYSQPLDDVYFKNGVIHSHWVVLFSCRPQDIGKLNAISKRLGKFAVNIKSYDSRFYKEEQE